MKRSAVVLSLAFFIGSSRLLFSETPGSSAGSPKNLVTPAASVPPTGGKFVINIAITIQSLLPASSIIACSVTASVGDLALKPTLSIFEVASANATVTGTSATCTVTIPYSWPLATPASDSVGLSYYVTATAPATPNLLLRQTSQPITVITVPANGATTTQDVAATI
jgi:hypothetical protein